MNRAMAEDLLSMRFDQYQRYRLVADLLERVRTAIAADELAALRARELEAQQAMNRAARRVAELEEADAWLTERSIAGLVSAIMIDLSLDSLTDISIRPPSSTAANATASPERKLSTSSNHSCLSTKRSVMPIT